MALEWNRRGHDDLAIGQIPGVDIGVRCYGRSHHEKGPLSLQCIIKEAQGLLGNNVHRMPSFITHGGFSMSLVGRVHVGIRVWIHEEIGAIKTIDMGAVVVVNGVSIEELAGVVSVIARFLEPDGQEVIVESPIYKLGVTA